MQTSGVTVRVKPVGVAEGDGGGTTAYSTDGVVLYTPTQAETNYTSFVLIAKKTACIPASITIVTTASSVAGKVDVDRLNGSEQSLLDLKDFADDGYDPATNKVQGVVLVDTTSTNSDMRGTDNAALAATWTGALATNIGTTNSTVATNLDATVSSRATPAQVNTECDTAISDAALATGIASIITTIGVAGAGLTGLGDARLAVLTNLATALELDGAVYRYTTNALEQAPTGGGGGLTGANSVTITVNDGASPLENVKVRATKGGLTDIRETNASGVISPVFTLNNGVWTISASLVGYTYTPSLLTVDGVESITISMTALTITPSIPGQVTGFLTCYNEAGLPEVGVEITMQQLLPIGEGFAFSGESRTVISDVNGLVEFTNLFLGAEYRLSKGGDLPQQRRNVIIPVDATDPYELPSILG